MSAQTRQSRNKKWSKKASDTNVGGEVHAARVAEADAHSGELNIEPESKEGEENPEEGGSEHSERPTMKDSGDFEADKSGDKEDE